MCYSLLRIMFISFFQSLEALQDGEHEKQRRHFLFFLLHQVPVSSNFSVLMRKKACQVAPLPSKTSVLKHAIIGFLQCSSL